MFLSSWSSTPDILRLFEGGSIGGSTWATDLNAGAGSPKEKPKSAVIALTLRKDMSATFKNHQSRCAHLPSSPLAHKMSLNSTLCGNVSDLRVRPRYWTNKPLTGVPCDMLRILYICLRTMGQKTAAGMLSPEVCFVRVASMHVDVLPHSGLRLRDKVRRGAEPKLARSLPPRLPALFVYVVRFQAARCLRYRP